MGNFIDYAIMTIVTLIIIGTLGYSIYIIRTKKLTMENLLVDYGDETIKTVAAVSTLVEIMSLTNMAVMQGRLDYGSALMRYGTIGTVEIILTFYFFYNLKRALQDAMKPGSAGGSTITKKEAAFIYIKSIPLYLIALMSTCIVAMLYIDSINVIELQMNGLLPTDWKIETDQKRYSLAAKAIPVGKVDLGALILIFMTPFFNLVLALKMIEYAKRDGKVAGVGAASAKPATPPATPPRTPSSPPAPSTPSLDPSNTVWQDFEDLIGLGKSSAMSKLTEYVGIDFTMSPPVSKTGPITHPDVKSGAKTPQEVLDFVIKEWIGDNNKGIKSIKYLSYKIKNHSDDLAKAIADAKSQVNNLSAGSVNAKANGRNAIAKAKSLMTTINDTENKRLNAYKSLEKELLRLGITSLTDKSKSIAIQALTNAKNENLSDIAAKFD